MKYITITTQKELDKLREVKADESVTIRGDANLELNANINVYGFMSIEAKINFRSSRVVAWGSSRVVAMESSSVVARGSSRVEAWGSSRVEAWGSSRVEARDSSRVVAWGSSRVEAWGSSSVVALGSSRVEARDSSSIHAFSIEAVIILFGYSACFSYGKDKIKKKSETALIQVVKKQDDFFERDAVPVKKSGKAIIYKRVSKDFKTQENTANETTWTPGTKMEHPSWNPAAECGEGKFHACSRPYFCDEFRGGSEDRYVAIEIKVADTHQFKNPTYPHKIAFRRGNVLYECDRFGDKIEAAK